MGIGIKTSLGAGLLSQSKGFSSMMNRRSGALSGLRNRSNGIKGTITRLSRGGRVALTSIRPMNTRYRGIMSHLGRSIDMRI